MRDCRLASRTPREQLSLRQRPTNTTRSTSSSRPLTQTNTPPLRLRHDTATALAKQDANGNETKWTYDSTHDVETIRPPKARQPRSNVKPTATQKSSNAPLRAAKHRTTKYKYDAYGDVESITDPSNTHGNTNTTPTGIASAKPTPKATSALGNTTKTPRRPRPSARAETSRWRTSRIHDENRTRHPRPRRSSHRPSWPHHKIHLRRRWEHRNPDRRQQQQNEIHLRCRQRADKVEEPNRHRHRNRIRQRRDKSQAKPTATNTSPNTFATP